MIMLFSITDRWYTADISSSGFGCGRPNKYGVYTNVAAFTRWIVEQILENSEPF